MSSRRDRSAALEWQQWVNAHEAELVAIGIPREVWEDRSAWSRFVGHGYHPPVSNRRDVRFSADDLPTEQQYRLYQFLAAVLPQPRYGYSLWAVLESRFAPADQQT